LAERRWSLPGEAEKGGVRGAEPLYKKYSPSPLKERGSGGEVDKILFPFSPKF